mmetsp:Transcript_67718/g.107255  ORF Transcript_67718/g.107255 Transcript_67718/m.107255 type:complete len:205 (+) Transcript_67718:505-1119(+)
MAELIAILVAACAEVKVIAISAFHDLSEHWRSPAATIARDMRMHLWRGSVTLATSATSACRRWRLCTTGHFQLRNIIALRNHCLQVCCGHLQTLELALQAADTRMKFKLASALVALLVVIPLVHLDSVYERITVERLPIGIGNCLIRQIFSVHLIIFKSMLQGGRFIRANPSLEAPWGKVAWSKALNSVSGITIFFTSTATCGS